MGDRSIFDTYLLNIRTDFSNYMTGVSSDIKSGGTKNFDQQVLMTTANQFTALMSIMNSFDPETTKHKLTVSQMQDVVVKINAIADTSYEIDFSIYY